MNVNPNTTRPLSNYELHQCSKILPACSTRLCFIIIKIATAWLLFAFRSDNFRHWQISGRIRQIEHEHGSVYISFLRDFMQMPAFKSVKPLFAVRIGTGNFPLLLLLLNFGVRINETNLISSDNTHLLASTSTNIWIWISEWFHWFSMRTRTKYTRTRMPLWNVKIFK